MQNSINKPNNMNPLSTHFVGDSSSFSPSISSTHSWTYDVFLSFRGMDTRYNFTDHLHSNLVRNGINAFMDDKLTRGEDISLALLKAIEESRISIIIFSVNYASSKWCLDELVKILQCKRSKQQMVLPVFYKVDPSDIRYQRGSFGDALAIHERNFKGNNSERVKRWRAALSEASRLAGWTLHGYESKFIHKIVEKISTHILKHSYLNVAKHPVGIEPRVRDVVKLLDIQDSKVHMVGIWGIGGIGKTTIAKAVYNSIRHKFDGSCFLANVREESLSYGGLLKLQKDLLSEILGGFGFINVTNVDEGINTIKKRLRQKSVLLILDDVSDVDQLNSLAGDSSWFGSHSRIIITTRDKLFLSAVDQTYEVKELNYHEGLELFEFHAFNKGNRHRKLDSELVNKITAYAGGHPLVLAVLGSHLCSISIDHWEEALNSYTRGLNSEIHKVLKISYDALEAATKEIFLHVACFFKGKNKDDVIEILESCGFYAKYGIEVLIKKALIDITKANDIRMHDRIEEMGKEIVRQESPNEPGERSRLWSYEDIYHVFVENTGTDKVKAIMVKNCGPELIYLRPESFLKMKNLQMLMIYDDIFCGDHLDYISKELRFLDWEKCPLRYFPHVEPRKLVLLKMHWSQTSLPEGLQMQNLKSMDLSGCGLTEIPNLSGFRHLVNLILRNCLNLEEVHPSVGFLDKLVELNLEGCQNLTTLPRTINLKSLEFLSLRYCHKLENFPEIVGEMKSLKCLDLGETAIKALPSSIRYLINLKKLDLSACEYLTNVPCSLFELRHLKYLDLALCRKLVTFPTDSALLPTNTVSLHANHSSLFINLSGCDRLLEISALPQETDCLDLSNCVSLERLAYLSNMLEGKELKMIRRLNLYNCERLCHNLALDIAKMERNIPANDDDDLVSALLSLFLSCQNSEFQIVFSGRKVPEWFRFRKEFGEPNYSFTCELCIEIPRHFKWDNKGLALCIAVETSIDVTRIIRAIHINGILIYGISNSEYVAVHLQESAHVWLRYIRFHTIIRMLRTTGMPPPYMCRVRFEFEYYDVVGSCGVHVVMPQDDDDAFVELLVHEVDRESGECSSFGGEDSEDDDLISEDEDSSRNAYLSRDKDHCDHQKAINPLKRKAS